MSSRDADFEQEYTQLFKNLALDYGDFLLYERDQSKRDIGLHLKKKHSSGSVAASSIIFFQFKGVMKTTLSEEEAKSLKEYSYPIKVEHLQKWYRYDTPTYFALYLESLNCFYYINIRDWVHRNLGSRIFAETQKTITVKIPLCSENKLDRDAFEKMFVKGEVLGWEKLVGDIAIEDVEGKEKQEIFEDCLYQHNLIRRISQIEVKEESAEAIFVDWQSKTRGEVLFFDPFDEPQEHHIKYSLSTFGEKRDPFFVYWQYMLSAEHLEKEFYFLEFYQDEEVQDALVDENGGVLELFNGMAYGEDCCGEAIQYELRVRNNNIGKSLLKWIERMESVGIIFPSDDCPWVSKAYWHKKET